MGSPEGHFNRISIDEESLDIPRFMDLIGNNPLIDMSNVSNCLAPGVKIYGKCKFMNPGLSMKDRIVKNMLYKAEEYGKLKKGGTAVAATSGSTGTSLAMLGTTKGLKAVITTSLKCSKKKIGGDCYVSEIDNSFFQR